MSNWDIAVKIVSGVFLMALAYLAIVGWILVGLLAVGTIAYLASHPLAVAAAIGLAFVFTSWISLPQKKKRITARLMIWTQQARESVNLTRTIGTILFRRPDASLWFLGFIVLMPRLFTSLDVYSRFFLLYIPGMLLGYLFIKNRFKRHPKVFAFAMALATANLICGFMGMIKDSFGVSSVSYSIIFLVTGIFMGNVLRSYKDE